MKTWRLRFASYESADDIFNTIVKKQKTIETRPAKALGSNKNYSNIKKGDKLIFCSVVSGREITKTAEFVHIYKSVEKMLQKEDWERIFPGVGSADKLLKIYDELKIKWGKKYKYQLEQYGIVAIGFK